MFFEARIKLTLWYLLIITLISGTFSLVIYRGVTTEIERFARAQRFRLEREFRSFSPPVVLDDPDLVEDAKKRLAIILITVNGSILVISGGIGYFLAGKTLRPIQLMVDKQNRFISDSSHELKTPLTVLRSTMEVGLRDKNMTLSEARKLVTENLKEVERLQHLTDSLLQLSQSGRPTNATSKKIKIKDIVNQAVQKMSPLATSKQIKLVVHHKEVTIFGNDEELTQLIIILLDNAIKYSQYKKTVSITVNKENKKATISIKDEGIGINKQDIPHIFDRFFRADIARSKNDNNGGYGLGLSIASQIVDKYSGTISVDSKIGKGSTFIISLPIA